MIQPGVYFALDAQFVRIIGAAIEESSQKSVTKSSPKTNTSDLSLVVISNHSTSETLPSLKVTFISL
jgi:hypothetical protein